MAHVLAPALLGMTGELVEIECDLINSLPGMVIVGLGNKAVEEARERVRSALKNSGCFVPPKRITLNLAPADLPKDGTGYDLGVAVAILSATGQIETPSAGGRMFFAELALDGSLRPVRGALVAAELAAERGLSEIYLAPGDAALASSVAGVKVYGVESLRQLLAHLTRSKRLIVVKNTTKLVAPSSRPTVDLANVYGQSQAKRALEIAAAGGHHLLLSGPPGAGKTLLSHALADLLPAPSPTEQLEIHKLYNIAGLTEPDGRPFRAPHHTASSIALIGGGATPRPGEISLSHRGVLLLDEAPEYPRSVIESLRGPLEDRVVTVSRALRSVTFPASFLLVATRNPCPCGYATDASRACVCSRGDISRYSKKLSGALLDRIDLCVEVPRLETSQLVGRDSAESTADVGTRVTAARELQRSRYNSDRLNAHLTSADLTVYCKLDPTAELLARQAIEHLGLSGRSYHRVLKVARTIADLAARPNIITSDLTEALQYRTRMPT